MPAVVGLSTTDRHVVLLADIHLDLGYNGTGRLRYGTYGTDSPRALVKAALAAAAAGVASPDAVLIAGDLVRHDTGSLNQSLRAYSTVNDDLLAAFPSSTLICSVLGNNDGWPDYAESVTTPNYYAAQAETAARNCRLGPDETQRLRERGYYSRNLWPGAFQHLSQ